MTTNSYLFANNLTRYFNELTTCAYNHCGDLAHLKLIVNTTQHAIVRENRNKLIIVSSIVELSVHSLRFLSCKPIKDVLLEMHI